MPQIASNVGKSALLPFFNPDIAIADELFRVIAAAVHLQCDAAGVGMAFLIVGEFHEANLVDPGGDFRRIAFDFGSQLIPFTMLPKLGPICWLDGTGDQRIFGFDFCDGVEKIKVAMADSTRLAFAIDPGEISVIVVIDHVLIGLSPFVAPQK